MAESNKHSLQMEENKIYPRGVRHPSVFTALLLAEFVIPNFHNSRCTQITTGKSHAFNFGKCTYITILVYETVIHYTARHDTTRHDDKIFFFGFDVLESTLAGHRQVRTKTDKRQFCFTWKKRIFCLSVSCR